MSFLGTLVGYLITVPLFLAWLLICGLLAMIGGLLAKKKIKIDLQQVKIKETVCRVLNDKGLLTDSEYQFETSEVAAQYDKPTFRGYLFILSPIIFLLKRLSFLDRFVLYVVRKWMAIHYFKKANNRSSQTFFARLARVCVSLASSLGQLLWRLN